jgi:hypothetical protein
MEAIYKYMKSTANPINTLQLNIVCPLAQMLPTPYRFDT